MLSTTFRRACVVAFVATAATLSAGNLDTLSNQSASYFFSTAQTASTAGASIIPYNPAGTALLEKGFYLDASTQTIFKFYSEKEDNLLKETYKQNEPTPSLPAINFVYNFGDVGPGRLAAYANGGICAGGGGLNWKDGTIGTNVLKYSFLKKGVNLKSTSFEASSVYYSAGGGLGYAFLDNLVSVSAGARYVNGQRSGKIAGSTDLLGDIVYDFDYTAQGVTPIFGVDVRPMDGLTLGLRYEMETAMKFKYATNEISAALKASGYDQDGKKITQDLPQVISFAAEYKFTPEFTMSAGTNVYLLNLAKYDVNGDGTNDAKDYFNTGYELNLAGQYQLTRQLLLGGTFMYSDQGVKKAYWEDVNLLTAASANPPLNSVTFGTGAKYNVWKSLDLLLTGAYIHYLPTSADVSAFNVTYNKEVVEVCLGASYKF